MEWPMRSETRGAGWRRGEGGLPLSLHSEEELLVDAGGSDAELLLRDGLPPPCRGQAPLREFPQCSAGAGERPEA